MGKDLTEVRSPQRKLMPDIAGLDNLESTSLRGIATRARVCKHHRFRNLYREINVDFLRQCFRELNPKAAKGVDDVTYDDYASQLEDRLRDLVERLKHKRYRARLVRRVMIPKGNGKERPLGIPALEDKLVQRAAAKLLSAIYEQDFIQSSYGYRPRRSAKGAIEDLTFNLQYGSYGHLVEADIQGFFDHLDHDWLIKMLKQRVDDKAFLGLIRKWLKAGILDIDGQILHPETGSPQGGIISPVLANIFASSVKSVGRFRYR
jgi:group II intron reverse transcriptase/maturase